MECFGLIVLIILGFALYGFFTAINHLLKRGNQPTHSTGNETSVDQQVRSTCTMLNGLCWSRDISYDEYSRLRDLLEKQYPFIHALPQRIRREQIENLRAGESPEVWLDEKSEVQKEPAPEPVPEATAESAEIIDAVLVPESEPTPWDDVPDEEPEPPPPRKPFSELLVGFMQEKNIRWGEIASGILIVGSAVGLVISLREELRRTIPFFPALVFMLITGGIHAAGIYTLQRWKLRDTSRGALVIGLLLVPLNFLAACVLTGQGEDRREITDPVYWIAILTGVAAFTAMTWFSSKYLLRRGQVPLVVAILACSLTQLFNNRIELPTTSWWMMLLTVPIVAGFLVGSVLAVPQQWNRRKWTSRAIHRLLLFLGLSVFSFAAAIALIYSRSGNYLHWTVALLPALGCVFATVAWIGAIVQQATSDDELPTLRITGTTLFILGTVLSIAGLLSSVVHPAAMLATSVVTGGLLCGLAINRRMPTMLMAVWACLGIAGLTSLNLALGKFQFDRWTNPLELREAVVSASGGLCFFVVGAVVLGCAWLLQRLKFVAAEDPKQRLINLASAGVMFGLGVIFAVAASLINPDNPFDVMTATILLFVIAALLFVATFRVLLPGVPYAANISLAAALLHALFWNRQVAEFVLRTSHGIDTRWACLGVVVAVTCSITALLLRFARKESATLSLDTYADSGHLAIWIAAISGLLLVPHASGFATGAICASAIAAVILAAATRRIDCALLFFGTTALATGAAVAEASLHFGWCESLVDAKHVWIQVLALSVWFLIWTANVWVLRGRPWCDWLIRHSGYVEEAVLHLAWIITAFLIVVSLSQNVSAEISRKIAMPADNYVQLTQNTALVIATLVVVALAIMASLLNKPAPYKLGTLVVVGFLACCVGSVPFETSRGVGSALRWLMPIGGVAVAFLFASRKVFARFGASLREIVARWSPPRIHGGDRATVNSLPSSSSWSNSDWQSLINLALGIVVATVLFISTLAVGQALLNGGSALGGPLKPSLLGDLRKDVSFGVPIAIIVGTFLFYAITERRGWLAIAGSGVFQYVVLLSLILLWASPHPKLATEWFLNILQAVSLGMTVYGFVWFANLNRIGRQNVWRDFPFSQLDLHAALNSLLVVSLAALILHHVFWFPEKTLGWINEAGGPLGYIALVLITGLVVKVWPDVLAKASVPFVGIAGLAATALIATTIDRYAAPISWWPFRTVLIGTVIVVIAQCVLTVVQRRRSPHVESALTEFPMLLFGAFAMGFAIRGGWDDPTGSWFYPLMMLLLIWTATGYGIALSSSRASWVAAAVAIIASHLMFGKSGYSSQELWYPHAWVLGIQFISFIWLGFYVFQRRVQRVPMPRNFVQLANVVALLSTGWMLLASLFDWLMTALGGMPWSHKHVLVSPMGLTMVVSTLVLLVLHAWNDRSKFWVVSRYLWTVSLAIGLVVTNCDTSEQRTVFVALTLGWLTAAWALYWHNRALTSLAAKQLGIPRLAAKRRLMSTQLPIIHLLIGGIVMVLVWSAIVTVEWRGLRILAAFGVVPLGFGFGAFSDARRVWIRWLSLFCVTLACVLLSWADLTPHQMRTDELLLPIRTFFVLAAAMFVYGAILPRMMNPASHWKPTIQHAAAATCGLSIVFFVAVLAIEAKLFQPEVGCGLPIPTAIAAAVMVLGMIVGLISIAVLPRHDPLSLSDLQRTGYVYVAEAVAAGLVAHLYLTMPGLFQLGIKQFWPYLAMLLSFGGVALSNVLAKRRLEVLAQPFFHTAAILPIMIALTFQIESQADAAVVMLLAGGIYLMISVTRASLASGVAAIIFGNLALWMFYNKFPAFEFLKHPQMWLIPPAISALVAAQIHRESFSKSQLASLRYLCVAVIYISSTSEIFISGIGDQLWPPIVLALLAIAGIMLGIMMQIRAYLFLGSLFLLMAMLSMVAHAQQRLNNVWPWWAFGIVMGISLLVFFGFFEKRKNDMMKIAKQMGEWDL